MAGNEADTVRPEEGVVLGFVEEVVPWRLRSSQFPSKVGGRPAWLALCALPSPAELRCDKCGQPSAFLLQVYAPIANQERAFHRTLFVFCCRSPSCYSHNDSRCFKVFRNQLPRRNEFYSYEPPPEEEPVESEADPAVLKSGLKLCRVCGCSGPKSCSRCYSAAYCSKEHQTIDWKAGHKNECAGKEMSGAAQFNKFLFSEFELDTEPEDLSAEDDKQSGALEQTHEHKDLNSSPFQSDGLEEKELEDAALHETKDSKMFQKFKQRTAPEPHQVLRYCRGGCPLLVSAEHIPSKKMVPDCPCGAKRIFEFQVMPQLLNHLNVDSPTASIDWGTLLVYSCEDSCDQGNKYWPEFIWKQDFPEDAAH
ncbi:programmed cell death protein 2-like [Arapaima gigas]